MIKEPEVIDVKDLRSNFKKSKSKNKFKKSMLFGYNISETEQYISSIEANRELEKNAFLDRIKELEVLIKSLHNEKEEWEGSLLSIKSRLEEYEQQCDAKDAQLKQSEQKISEYEDTLMQCEQKLKEREDAVVLIENTSLKEQLSTVMAERNSLAGQCEILKNENQYQENKIQTLEGEVNDLTEKLANEVKTARDQLSDLSLQIIKMTDGASHANERMISSLEDILFYNKNYKKDADIMIKKLKDTLSSIN